MFWFLYIKRLSSHTWGIIRIFFFVTSICFKVLAEVLETCGNNLRLPKRKSEMSWYKPGLAMSESLQATIYPFFWARAVLTQVLAQIMLLCSSTIPWEKWAMLRNFWKWLGKKRVTANGWWPHMDLPAPAHDLRRSGGSFNYMVEQCLAQQSFEPC